MDNEQTQQQKPELTREEKRRIERIEMQANSMFRSLQEYVLDVFMELPIDDFKVNAKSISSKWKTYCASKGLHKDAYYQIDIFVNSLESEYNKNQNDDTSGQTS